MTKCQWVRVLKIRNLACVPFGTAKTWELPLDFWTAQSPGLPSSDIDRNDHLLPTTLGKTALSSPELEAATKCHSGHHISVVEQCWYRSWKGSPGLDDITSASAAAQKVRQPRLAMHLRPWHKPISPLHNQSSLTWLAPTSSKLS